MLFSLGILSVWLIQPAPAQTVDSTYWFSHAAPLNLQDPSYRSFDMLDSVVANYAFFFTAEQHWRSINTKIQFSFLRYLHQHAQVRHLVVEGGYSYGFLLNEYLESGDERLLRKVTKDMPICPEDQMRLFRRIHQYNQDLPEQDRIQVTGIDLEHSPLLVLQTLNRLLPEGDAPRRVRKYREQVRRLHEAETYDPDEVKKFFRRFDRVVARHAGQFQEAWGSDYDLFRMILENTVQGYKFTWLRSALFQSSWQEREARMYQNFLTIAPRLKSGNFYGQFGALHTDIEVSQIWDFPSLAHRLNFTPTSPVRDEVLTISRYVRNLEGNYERLNEADLLHEAVKTLERRFRGSVILFSLIGRGSPFREMSKTFQFMMLIDPKLEEESCE